MERVVVTHGPSGFAIEGFPDAVKALKLTGPVAKRLSEVWLHKNDLDFAADALQEINTLPLEFRVKRESLWRSAVIHYVKCFGTSKSRFQLSAAKIFRGDATAQTVHRFVVDLRDKHIVHDENPFATCVPTALINSGEKPFKIEKIVCVAGYVQTLNEANWSNLKLLVERVHAWVEREFDAICDRVCQDLEKQSHEELLSREAAEIRVPCNADVGSTRNAP